MCPQFLDKKLIEEDIAFEENRLKVPYFVLYEKLMIHLNKVFKDTKKQQ
jgi:hypothetical protein